jgi:hypothetical protein
LQDVEDQHEIEACDEAVIEVDEQVAVYLGHFVPETHELKNEGQEASFEAPVDDD